MSHITRELLTVTTTTITTLLRLVTTPTPFSSLDHLYYRRYQLPLSLVVSTSTVTTVQHPHLRSLPSTNYHYHYLFRNGDHPFNTDPGSSGVTDPVSLGLSRYGGTVPRFISENQVRSDSKCDRG